MWPVMVSRSTVGINVLVSTGGVGNKYCEEKITTVDRHLCLCVWQPLPTLFHMHHGGIYIYIYGYHIIQTSSISIDC